MKRLISFFKSLWNRKTLKAAAAMKGEKVSLEQLSPEMKVALKIFNAREKLVASFRGTTAGASALTRNSMNIAFEAGVNAAIALLVPESKPQLKIKTPPKPTQIRSLSAG